VVEGVSPLARILGSTQLSDSSVFKVLNASLNRFRTTGTRPDSFSKQAIQKPPQLKVS